MPDLPSDLYGENFTLHNGTNSKPIRVVIADDFPPFLQSITQLIHTLNGLEDVGSATDGAELLTMCETRQPEVVLVDIEMPLIDGITATREIKRRWPEVVVIGLTGFDEMDRNQDLIEAGATLCLSKTTSASELYKHILSAIKTHRDAPTA